MTTMHLAVFIVSLLGFAALALAMPVHCQHLLRRILPASQRQLLHVMGWLLLAVALTLGIRQWHAGIGMVAWLGWLSVAGLVLVFYLPRWPWQPEARNPSHNRRRDANRVEGIAPVIVAPAPLPQSMRAGILLVALLIPLSNFAWQLWITPQKSVLRDDAIQGVIGPWSFTIAEKDREPPTIEAMDVPLKEFVIRFCEECDAQIRMAYLKVRKPHSLRAAGNAFEGRGREKTAEVPLPRAATLDDGLWLTVESTDGEVYEQAFDIEQLSPALATFIRERL